MKLVSYSCFQIAFINRLSTIAARIEAFFELVYFCCALVHGEAAAFKSEFPTFTKTLPPSNFVFSGILCKAFALDKHNDRKHSLFSTIGENATHNVKRRERSGLRARSACVLDVFSVSGE